MFIEPLICARHSTWYVEMSKADVIASLLLASNVNDKEERVLYYK